MYMKKRKKRKKRAGGKEGKAENDGKKTFPVGNVDMYIHLWRGKKRDEREKERGSQFMCQRCDLGLVCNCKMLST